MPIDPSFLPPAASPEEIVSRRERMPVTALNRTPLAAATPHLGHTLLFFVFVLLAGILIGTGFALSLKHMGLYLHETAEQMQTDPRVVIPLEAVVYAVAAAASMAVFPLLWTRSFGAGVHWCRERAARGWWALVVIGVVTCLAGQMLSNFLPIPKELPIDKFFTNRLDVWLVAIFGVTVAPAFEELAFRGFLMPSLASAWDWVAQRGVERRAGRAVPPAEWQEQAAVYGSLPAEDAPVFHRTAPTAGGDTQSFSDPQWSAPAIIFAVIVTSIGFARLHSDQLAHSLAPVSVLFGVSVVLCLTRLRFRSLAASTLVHSMYNATIFILLFVETSGFTHLDKISK